MKRRLTVRKFGGTLSEESPAWSIPFLTGSRLLAALLFLLVVPWCKAESNRRDGNWWRAETNKITKAVYVTGLFDGIAVGRNFAIWGQLHQPNAQLEETIQESLASFQSYAKKVSGATSGQVMDGLDEFYNDYRNRRILTVDAFWVVIRNIAGDSKEEIDQTVLNLRKKDAR